MYGNVLGLPYSQNKHSSPTDVFRFIRRKTGFSALQLCTVRDSQLTILGRMCNELVE
jgi:hypothetical protein